ncbi:hypothetical protein FGO68_gene5293 [Halteria grandinella]|uniref:Uncharacterized protein n=1 Tax=Halteria grandinella TaxID=5974 RepID=A0A8J8P6W4_HALGN|nr:hypothetical protein FGO68_gene5293 [Halteria grandinella]
MGRGGTLLCTAACPAARGWTFRRGTILRLAGASIWGSGARQGIYMRGAQRCLTMTRWAQCSIANRPQRTICS